MTTLYIEGPGDRRITIVLPDVDPPPREVQLTIDSGIPEPDAEVGVYMLYCEAVDGSFAHYALKRTEPRTAASQPPGPGDA